MGSQHGILRNFAEELMGTAETNVNCNEMFTREYLSQRPPMTFTLDCGNNGTVICGKHIPEEVLSLIFSYLDCQSLLNSRRVCQRWKNLIDADIWRFKLEKNTYRKLQSILCDIANPFPIFYKVYKNKPFNRNLIKNASGQENLKHWEILKNGGDGWIVEDPPAGSVTLPLDEEFSITSCFATSFSLCSKVQIIDLWDEGLTPIIMEELKPTIYVSEMFTARKDCASTYTICVLLLNGNHEEIDCYQETKRIDQWQASDWYKVEHEFKDCKDVRFIKFFHNGADCQFWKGHYGSKMSRACVKLIL